MTFRATESLFAKYISNQKSDMKLEYLALSCWGGWTDDGRKGLTMTNASNQLSIEVFSKTTLKLRNERLREEQKVKECILKSKMCSCKICQELNLGLGQLLGGDQRCGGLDELMTE